MKGALQMDFQRLLSVRERHESERGKDDAKNDRENSKD